MRFRLTKYHLFGAVVIFFGGALLGSTIESGFSKRDLTEQLRKLERAYGILVTQYVEEVPAEQLTETAIKGMLTDLDPHSTYIDASELKEIREGFQGSFGGIGVWFEVVSDTPRVSSVISDGPSEAAGIRAGDRIVLVDDSTAVGPASRRIQYRLKGPIGSDVKITVQRHNVPEPIDFEITRGRIPLYSIDTAYMISDRTGYVRINRFAATTYNEFMEKVRMLKERGMQRIIVDFRSNPGGVMDPAIRISDEFLGADYTIVETRGRIPAVQQKDTADGGDTLESMPAIVLVDQNSASSSEIVAGALQDNDRALIVGQRTFGKALVQQQFPLDDGSVLHLTVARYYTPAGRLIQTPYHGADMRDYLEGKLEVSNDITSLPDSVKFQTLHDRTVVGSGGVYPDEVVRPDSTSPLYQPLVRTVLDPGHDVRFVRDLFDNDRDEWMKKWGERRSEFESSFDPGPLVAEFWKSLEARGIEIGPGKRFSEADRRAANPTIGAFIKARVAQQLYGTEAWYPLTRQFDPEVNKAMELWPEAEALARYHGWTGYTQ
ncbi:MAG: S41 family peptidase [Bacteroidetes bacterium]|nr:S41 family peptidase [Bacteroidota bacterium]